MSLYEVLDHAPLVDPVLVLGLDGWIDAGGAAETAMTHIRETVETLPVARFDTDRLLDHRARRPVVRIVDGVYRDLSWPTIELHAATDPSGTDFLLLTGPEPDHEWVAFADAVVGLTLDYGVRLVAGLGAYPAPAPHTRPARLAVTSATTALADRLDWIRGTLDVPAGVQAVIELRAADAGVDAVGVWAQVPHYLAGMSYPAASVALLEGLAEVAGLTFDLGPLRVAASAARTRLDDLVANSEEHTAMVHQLETYVDAEVQAGRDLPSGDELAAEIQRFLREQSGDG